MVALLFTATFIVGLLAIALYFWAPRAKGPQQDLLPPSEAPRGLFSDEQSIEFATSRTISSQSESDRKAERISLSERASTGDKSVLNEAHDLRDTQFYNELLDEFTGVSKRAPALLSLVSYVKRNELPINRKLAEAVITLWRNSPDRSSTATTLHLTALADDADLFRSTMEAALSFWQQGLLPNVSAAELRALFDGEFWVLSERSRNSGAGFILKRALANARRELETAMRVN